MGSGKTSVGRALAERVDVEFFDTDAWVEGREARSVAAIFQESGEAFFRAREAEALEEACRLRRAVVATGGGLFAQEAHRDRIRGRGVSIWLDTPLDRIWERCVLTADRPLWGTREELSALLEARRESYAAADWRITVADRGVQEIAQEAERLITPQRREV